MESTYKIRHRITRLYRQRGYLDFWDKRGATWQSKGSLEESLCRVFAFYRFKFVGMADDEIVLSFMRDWEIIEFQKFESGNPPISPVDLFPHINPKLVERVKREVRLEQCPI